MSEGSSCGSWRRRGGGRGTTWVRILREHAPDSGWIPGNDGPCGDVSCDDGAGPDNRMFSDGDAAKQGCVGADGGTLLDDGRETSPVRLRLGTSVFVGGPGQQVVGEHDAVADKDIILNGDATADEGMTGNLASSTDPNLLLDLYEGSDLRVVSDFTPVEIDEAKESNARPELNIG